MCLTASVRSLPRWDPGPVALGKTLGWWWAPTGPDPGPGPQSIIRVVFHDRRLQYTEHQQLEGWRWSRPGDRILDIGGFLG